MRQVTEVRSIDDMLCLMQFDRVNIIDKEAPGYNTEHHHEGVFIGINSTNRHYQFITAIVSEADTEELNRVVRLYSISKSRAEFRENGEIVIKEEESYCKTYSQNSFHYGRLDEVLILSGL